MAVDKRRLAHRMFIHKKRRRYHCGAAARIPSVVPNEPETIIQQARILAAGGAVIDSTYANQAIAAMKAQGIYSSCKFLGDANMGVKKDGSGAVSVLYDWSGNSNDAIQLTGSAQPIWTANQQGTRAGLVFDGSKRLVTATSVFTDDALAVFAVYKGSPQSNAALISQSDANNTGRIILIASTDAVGTNKQKIFFYNGGSRTNDTTTIAFDDTAKLGETHGDGTGNWEQRINGGVSEGTITGQTLTPLNTTLRIGGSATPEYTGTIISVYCFNALALSTVQRQAIEGVINTYYAIY